MPHDIDQKGERGITTDNSSLAILTDWLTLRKLLTFLEHWAQVLGRSLGELLIFGGRVGCRYCHRKVDDTCEQQDDGWDLHLEWLRGRVSLATPNMQKCLFGLVKGEAKENNTKTRSE